MQLKVSSPPSLHADELSWQALDYSNRVQGTKPHLAHIFSATRGIVFLGTPHRGSSTTSFAKVVASVAQVALQNPNVDLIRDLERDSQTLDRIRESFSRILYMCTLTVWTFVEELAMKGVGKVYFAAMHSTT